MTDPENAMYYVQLWRAVATLEPRRLQVVQLHTQGASFGECGAELGVSRERARQLYQSAIRKLRHRRFGFPSDTRKSNRPISG